MNAQGQKFIWVCELDSRREVWYDLVQILKSEEAALYTDIDLTIGCRQGRPPVITDCADAVLEEPMLKSTRTALMRLLREHSDMSLVLRTTLADGSPLP